MDKKQKIEMDVCKLYLDGQADAFRVQTTKASIMIAACSVLLGISANIEIEGWRGILPSAFLALSALFCLASLWPREVERGAIPARAREILSEHDSKIAYGWLLRAAQQSVRHNDRKLTRAGWYLRLGMAFLVLGAAAPEAVKYLGASYM